MITKRIWLSAFLFTMAVFIYTGKAYAQRDAGSPDATTAAIHVDTSSQNIIKGATFQFPQMDEKIHALLNKYDLPGATVAVIRNEKLVYINCYGFQNPETETPATNDNLFRIASISKPITVVTLLKLMQEGKLSMDSKVFGEGSILGEDFGNIPPGSDWNNITIRHLIEHTSGIHNIPNDPMFSYMGLNNKEVISQVIKERQLTTRPGEQYYYSNIGYNILGRVIEKVTGKAYHGYVKENIFAPCGISRMQIAGNTKEDRLPDEVTYTQPDEQEWVYNMDVSRMDSHGGWVASATDLARFITHIDRNIVVPDIIEKNWLELTYMGYPQWTITGSLPGTSTMLSRINDQFSFVILINRRSFVDGYWDDIFTSMQSAIEERKDWPEVDLFNIIKW